ncbi:MAG TPA: ABC transporter permease [Methylomirabilota bacterium]|nr:ABC transporter permease [Methylomirabilota bacterium]
MNSLFPILAIVRKDISVWLRQPTSIAATVLPAIAFMVILYFGAQAVGRNPVALVVQDSGPHAQELVNILSDSGAFKVGMITITPQKAEDALKQVKVAAVITIPSNFDAAYNAQKPDPVTIHINNLNLDFTNDLRRSLPAAITEFYAEKGNSSHIQIHVKETDLRSQDIDLLRFELVPNLVLLLTTAGSSMRDWLLQENGKILQ